MNICILRIPANVLLHLTFQCHAWKTLEGWILQQPIGSKYLLNKSTIK